MLYRVITLAEGGRRPITLEAAHAEDAADQARRQGHTVLTVAPASALGLPGFARRYRFPLDLFSRELLALLGSGLSLVEALQTLAEKESRGEARRVLEQVLEHIYQGETLSAALARYPDAFPPLYVATVRASEKTSDLPEALSRYLAYSAQFETLRKKVAAAAIFWRTCSRAACRAARCRWLPPPASRHR